MDYKSSTIRPGSLVQGSRSSKTNLVLNNKAGLPMVSEAPNDDQMELYNDRQTTLRYLFLAAASFLLVATQMINANIFYAQNPRAFATNQPIIYIYHLSFAICFLSLIGLLACMYFERVLWKSSISLEEPLLQDDDERRRVLSRLTNVVSSMVIISGLLLVVGVWYGCLWSAGTM